MTVYLPLDAPAPLPQSPHFLLPSAEPTTHVQKVVKAILKAKRIAVLCGAGISVRAGIPDFRSETGLFQTLKKDHASLSSGKDLFDASVFNSEATTTLFCKMVAGLADLAKTAQPTSFHHMLRALDDRGRLLRVYTQNIDALEMKAGLTFGVPELDVRRGKPRSSKGVSDSEAPVPGSSANMADRLPTPPAETPRCIPLHGTLQTMHCQICLHSFPLEQYLEDLNAGTFPICPDCSEVEETRQAVGKRLRGIGKLRPSVVLYNEMHKDGEEVGEVVTRDLVGSSKGKGRAGADLLIVVGTSLRVPGTKRMVREFSKAIRSRSAASSGTQGETATSGPSNSSTQSSQSSRSSGTEDETPIKTIYLNLDFPVPTREWEGVFDVWIRGDAQTFARLVQQEIEREEQAKEAALERKRKREELKLEVDAAAEAAEAEPRKRQLQAKAKITGKTTANRNPKYATVLGNKRKAEGEINRLPGSSASKKRKTTANRKVGNRTRRNSLSAQVEDKLKITVPSKHRLREVRSHTSQNTPPTPPPSRRQPPQDSTVSSPISSPPRSPPTLHPASPARLSLSGSSSSLTDLSLTPPPSPSLDEHLSQPDPKPASTSDSRISLLRPPSIDLDMGRSHHPSPPTTPIRLPRASILGAMRPSHRYSVPSFPAFADTSCSYAPSQEDADIDTMKDFNDDPIARMNGHIQLPESNERAVGASSGQ